MTNTAVAIHINRKTKQNKKCGCQIENIGHGDIIYYATLHCSKPMYKL